MPGKVAIIGAGLAGLACAAELERNGVKSVVFEASDSIGGRLKTIDQLDLGFQVCFSAYPNLRKELDPLEIPHHAFAKGALIFDGMRIHRFSVEHPIEAAFSPIMPLFDKLRMLYLCLIPINSGPDESAGDFLPKIGFSKSAMDHFLRPFFGGIFLDRNLGVSRKQFQFVFKTLLKGKTLSFSPGIAALPTKINTNPDYFLSTRVDKIRTVESGFEILTSEGIFAADHVVVATEASVAGDLAGEEIPTSHRSSIAVHIKVSRVPFDRRYIVLNGTWTGVINQISSQTDESITVTILGKSDRPDEDLFESVQSELTTWFPNEFVSTWRLIRVDRIEFAQLTQYPGFQEHRPKTRTQQPNLYLAGEFVTNSSIDGAIESGHLAAKSVLEDMNK